ncbi:MAG: hypothetical protein ACK6DR_10295 [Gemmatimonas sp.]|uniref:hypothetical protein n=1 Tax=Gemmatimonas sp. TaxID=1962908 RepID=UPI00391F0A00
MRPDRISPFRGPLIVVMTFLGALLALSPGAARRGRPAPTAARAVPPNDGAVDLSFKRPPRDTPSRPSGTVARATTKEPPGR